MNSFAVYACTHNALPHTHTHTHKFSHRKHFLSLSLSLSVSLSLSLSTSHSHVQLHSGLTDSPCGWSATKKTSFAARTGTNTWYHADLISVYPLSLKFHSIMCALQERCKTQNKAYPRCRCRLSAAMWNFKSRELLHLWRGYRNTLKSMENLVRNLAKAVNEACRLISVFFEIAPVANASGVLEFC